MQNHCGAALMIRGGPDAHSTRCAPSIGMHRGFSRRQLLRTACVRCVAAGILSCSLRAPPLFHGFSGQNRFIRTASAASVLREPWSCAAAQWNDRAAFFGGRHSRQLRSIVFTIPSSLRRHRFAFEHDRFHQFHRFHQFPGVFPVAPFVFFEEVPNQVQVFVDPNAVDEADVEDTAPEAPVIAPPKPTWRSGNSALTGTLEKPRVIIVSPAKKSGSVQIFAPSAPSGHGAQVVEVPNQ